MTSPLYDDVTQSAQAAKMMADDIQAAHKTACYGDTETSELAAILLLDALNAARKLEGRLKLIQDAIK